MEVWEMGWDGLLADDQNTHFIEKTQSFALPDLIIT